MLQLAAMVTQLRPADVDLDGLMRVLGEALYSTPAVAIRELVQNAHDSCLRRRIETGGDTVGSIRVGSDPIESTVTIEDTGAGLTDGEIEKYLARIGAGITRGLRDQGERDQGLIGYFGLGFLSAHVIARHTRVWTCSHKSPDHAWLFDTRGGQSYSLRPGPSRPIGTRVTLWLKREHRELAEAALLSRLTARYCCLLPIPVEVHGERINSRPPPWRSKTETNNTVRRGRAMEFARRFEPRAQPICTMAIGEQGGPCQGLAWVQQTSQFSSSDTRRVSIFVRGMAVNHDERELLPRWASFIGATIENNELSPTASRESLQRNSKYHEASEQIREELINGLLALAQQGDATWQSIRHRHPEALLAAALAEARLFRALRDQLTVPTSEGNMTLPALLRHGQNKIYLGRGNLKRGHAELLSRALGHPIVDASRYAAAAFCRMYTEQHRGELVDLSSHELDEEAQQEIFAPSELDSERSLQLVNAFAHDDFEVEARAFDPDFLPFVVLVDRNRQTKQSIESREAEARISGGLLKLARMHTARTSKGSCNRLFLNTRSPSLRRILEADESLLPHFVRLLWPLANLMSEGSEDSLGLERAFRGLAPALDALVRAY